MDNIAQRSQACLRAVIAKGPTDRGAAEAAICRVYEHFGKPAPTFVWYTSPNSFSKHLETLPPGDRTQREFCDPIEHGRVHGRVHDIVHLLNGAVGVKWKSTYFVRMMLPLACAVAGRNRAASDLMFAVMQIIPFWVALDQTCVCCDRPTNITVDPAFRLQSRDGAPALSYADGWEIFADRGTMIPIDWTKILTHDQMVVQMRQVQASDHRRLAFQIDRYGREKFCKEFCRVVDNDERYGTLYSSGFMQWNNIDEICFLKVLNSTPTEQGGQTTHFLRVPPRIGRALNAVAWTFNIDPREYSEGLAAEA